MKALREIRRTLRENLLLQFSLVSLLSVIALAVALATLIGRATASQVLEEAMRSAMEDVNARTLRHLTPEDFVHSMLGERYEAFDQFVTEFIVSRRIARIKIWDREGRVIFSTDPSQVGQTFPMKPTLAKALQGETAGTISVPQGIENAQERLLGTLIEVYTPVIFPGSREVVGAIEVYQYYAPYAETIAAMQRHTSVAIGAGAMLLYGVLFLIVRQGWRTIQVQQGEIYQLAAFPRENPSPVLASDQEGNVIYVNPSAERVLKQLGIELTADFLPVNHPQLVRACLEGEQGFRNVELTIRDRVFSWTYHPLSAFDVVHLYATEITERERAEEAMRKLNAELELRVEERTAELKATNERLQREITERKRVEEALREGEERFRELYEEAPIAYYSVGVDGRICRANRNTAEMSGYALDDLVGRPVFDLYADTPAGKEKAAEVFQRFRAGEEIRGEELEWRTADGRSVWISITVRPFRDAEGRVVESRAMAVDITDRKRAEEQLLHDAFHDALTGLPNRALFVDRMIQAIERAKRHEEYMFAVLFLDLDRFKVVNDSLGHTIGDELLIAIARRLEVCLRAIDTVARLGGDEFVLLVEDIEDVSDATRVAERVQEELRLPFNLHGHEVFTTASIGIVLSTTGYDRPEEILRDADIAMYRAKVRGKARYELFDTAMRDRAVARLELETELRRAIERQEFRVHYQPIVSLAAGRIAGFEALLRWQHPERGLVSPGEFIPVAEETGLIIPIGQWVLREACQQMRDWQVQFPGGPPLTISVNLFRRQFQQPDLVEQVEQILQGTGLDARSLRLEITESVIMENTESATAMLSQLKAMGVQVQMDDFGTGYSSLSYLNQFPIDTIKIDRTFVSKMGVDGNHSGIVHTMLTLARDLGMDTIAEGVETAEQLAYLKELECEYGQGYHLSKPLDSEAAEALIAHRAAEQENFEPSLVKTLDPPSVSHPLPTHPEDSRFLHG